MILYNTALDKAFLFDHKILIFVYFHKNIYCWYPFEAPIAGSSYKHPQHKFLEL